MADADRAAVVDRDAAAMDSIAGGMAAEATSAVVAGVTGAVTLVDSRGAGVSIEVAALLDSRVPGSRVEEIFVVVDIAGAVTAAGILAGRRARAANVGSRRGRSGSSDRPAGQGRRGRGSTGGFGGSFGGGRRGGFYRSFCRERAKQGKTGGRGGF